MDINTPAGETLSSPLVNALERFNRKERFHLLRLAVGQPLGRLDAQFREELGRLLKIDIPADAWWAFDYHIDWLFGALLAVTQDINKIGPQPNPHPGYEMGTQEDCDLVIAFGTTLILIEAKTGAWSTKQMKHKIARLHALPIDQISRYLVLASPKQPTKLEVAEWPDWALNDNNSRKPFWLELPFMTDIEPLLVSRCDLNGTRSQSGDHWRVYSQNQRL